MGLRRWDDFSHSDPCIVKDGKLISKNEYLKLRGVDAGQCVCDRCQRKVYRDDLHRSTKHKPGWYRCEGIYFSPDYATIEHFYPKSIWTRKTFDYENLRVYCWRCNQEKGDDCLDALSEIKSKVAKLSHTVD